MSIQDLVKSIVSNPSAHIVDREKKMNDTIDVMCKNRDIAHGKALQMRAQLENVNSRGYGEGRNTGD